ncbi:MAG: hypothetical protein ACXVBQ_17185, partial [Pseudobdellovibrionaceae bacterium]
REYLQKVDTHSPAEGAVSCQHLYSKALDKGALDIRYALGYMDDSNGEEKVWGGINYGLSPSLDIEIFQSIYQVLTENCKSSTMRLCGFSASGTLSSGKVVLQKYVDLYGKRILVNLTLTQASASPYFLKNKGELAARQTLLTQQSEENFFEGLKVADVAFYNGHSRNGGGPDFAPPVLDSRNHVNYKGYYEIKRTGILKTLASMKQNSNKELLLGLFSCFSQLHFYKTFMHANPKQPLILSSDRVSYFDALKGSMGYLEGVLRGTCGQDLAGTAKQEDSIRDGFLGYNIN